MTSDCSSNKKRHSRGIPLVSLHNRNLCCASDMHLTPGLALVGEAATHAHTIFRGKNFEFKLFFRGENIEQVNTIFRGRNLSSNYFLEVKILSK